MKMNEIENVFINEEQRKKVIHFLNYFFCKVISQTFGHKRINWYELRRVPATVKHEGGVAYAYYGAR